MGIGRKPWGFHGGAVGLFKKSKGERVRETADHPEPTPMGRHLTDNQLAVTRLGWGRRGDLAERTASV